jgi:hypothetical protein
MKMQKSLAMVVVLTGTLAIGFLSLGNSSAVGVGEGEFPLDVLVDADSERALFEARQILLRDCMVDAGFEYSIPEYIPDPQYPRYGLQDAETAAEFGYAWLDNIGLSNEGDPNAEFAKTAGWEEAFFGDFDARYQVPDDNSIVLRPGVGCIWESDLVLYGESPVDHYTLTMAVSGVRGEAAERFMTDSRTGTVAGEWSACMEDAGFDAVAPWEAASLRTDADPDGKSAAVADVGCKEQTDLVARFAEIESLIQAELMAKNADLIQDWLASTAASVDRANAVVSGG